MSQDIPPPPPQDGGHDSGADAPPPPHPAEFGGSPAGLADENDKLLAAVAHLGGVLGLVVNAVGVPIPLLGVIVPVAMFFIYKDKSDYVRWHSLQEIYWQVAMLAAFVVMLVLTFVTCGLGLLITCPVAILLMIMNIYAAWKAFQGERWSYPVSGEWRFLDGFLK